MLKTLTKVKCHHSCSLINENQSLKLFVSVQMYNHQYCQYGENETNEHR